MVGDFKNGGRDYRPRGEPEEVRVHDFLIKELGRAAPYGVYDLAANAGWVSVGMNHDTSAFAVNSIRRLWQSLGRARYPNATRLLITADGGGSNGSRVRLWKCELQSLANDQRDLVCRTAAFRGDERTRRVGRRRRPPFRPRRLKIVRPVRRSLAATEMDLPPSALIMRAAVDTIVSTCRSISAASACEASTLSVFQMLKTPCAGAWRPTACPRRDSRVRRRPARHGRAA